MGRPVVLAEKNRLFRALGERPEFWGALGGVILGQAVLFGGLRPFALSYLAASMLKERRMGVAAAAGILAALAAGGVNGLGVCEMMLVCLLTLVFWPDKWRGRRRGWQHRWWQLARIWWSRVYFGWR